MIWGKESAELKHRIADRHSLGSGVGCADNSVASGPLLSDMVLHAVILLPSSSSAPQTKYLSRLRGEQSQQIIIFSSYWPSWPTSTPSRRPRSSSSSSAAAFLPPPPPPPSALFLPYLIPLASQCEDRFVLGSSTGRPETEVQVERRPLLK